MSLKEIDPTVDDGVIKGLGEIFGLTETEIANDSRFAKPGLGIRLTAILNNTMLPREVAVLNCRWWLNISYKETARQVQVTESNARNIYIKALRKLRHPSRASRIMA